MLVHFTKVNPEKNSRGKTKDEKIIVSDKGIYIGEVKDRKAHGKGIFYFSQVNMRLKDLYFKGSW